VFFFFLDFGKIYIRLIGSKIHQDLKVIYISSPPSASVPSVESFPTSS